MIVKFHKHHQKPFLILELLINCLKSQIIYKIVNKQRQ